MAKLVVITQTFFPAVGGVETFIEHYLLQLSKKNYDIHIFTSDINFKTRLSEYQHNGLKVSVIESLNIAGIVIPISLRNIFTLLKALRRANFVHQHDLKFLSGLLVLTNFIFSFRLILFSHGYMYHSKRFGLLKKAFMSFFSVLSKRYWRIINISTGDFAVARKYRFSNSILIKEAVDLSRFFSIRKSIEANRYLYFGRIAKNKGLENLFKCLSTLTSWNYRLVIVGNGDPKYISELQALAGSFNILSYIVWKHNVPDDDLQSEISLADIIFLPSTYEGFGISLLESVASRSKIMAHPNVSYTEILNQIQLSQYLFDFKDFMNFESKLQSVLALPVDARPKLSAYDHEEMICKIEAAQLGC